MKKIILASILLISLFLVQFSNAATFSHETAFTIEDYMGERILRYYPYVLSLEGQMYWAKLCLYCDSEEMQTICKCGDQTNLKLAERNLIFNGDKEASQVIIDSLEQQFDSGAQPLGISAMVSEIYNPIVQADALGYLSSDGLIKIKNDGEIAGGILRISDSSKDLKRIIYPRDITNRNVFLKSATIDFDNKKINLDTGGQYDYGLNKNPCGSTAVSTDSITIKKIGEGNLEIPYSPGALSSCSSAATALNEYKNYERNIWQNIWKSSLSYFDNLFSGTSRVCVKSDTTFQEYYYVCNNDYSPLTIKPTTDSSFVLNFNEGDKIDDLTNVFCGSNSYTVSANYKAPASIIAKQNIRLNNPKCFRFAKTNSQGTDGSIVDVIMTSDGIKYEDKVRVSNKGDLSFNLNPSVAWGENNEFAYGENKISSQDGITTFGKFSIIDSFNENAINLIKSV